MKLKTDLEVIDWLLKCPEFDSIYKVVVEEHFINARLMRHTVSKEFIAKLEEVIGQDYEFYAFGEAPAKIRIKRVTPTKS